MIPFVRGGQHPASQRPCDGRRHDVHDDAVRDQPARGVERVRELRGAEVMATDLVYVEPEQTAEACMAIMTEKRIRHLPVLSEGRLVGIISIGDLMKSIIADQKFSIDQLVRYVSG